MKILSISDTHGLHKLVPKNWLIPADTIVHAGDISNRGYIEEAKQFLDWFESLDYKNKIFIAGNHDWGFETHPDKIKELLENYPSVTYLQDTGVEIDGIKFWGSPQTPYFHNWAFNCARNDWDAKSYNKPLISHYRDMAPMDINVLITHGPPYGIGDFVPYGKGEHVGCKDLLDKIHNMPDLKLHISGHIHCGYGERFRDGKNFINAATCDEQYQVTQTPILYEI